jgi:hypothetical protein
MTNTYELKYPSNYVEVSEEEMMYVDGGATIKLNIKTMTVAKIVMAAQGGLTAGAAASACLGPFTAGLGWIGSALCTLAGIALGWIVTQAVGGISSLMGYDPNSIFTSVSIWVPFVRKRTITI